MSWYLLLGALAALLLVSLVLPVPRRVWSFVYHLKKYFWLWVADRVGLRRLALRLRGRPYERLTRPMLFRMFAEDMGPTFLKFGQIIASSAGLFPDEYVKEFQKVLDRVRPFSFEDVKRTLAEDLGPERAARLVELEPTPLASASIAQVHTATLDDGTKLVVKVQRPGIAARTAADMKILRFAAGIVARFKTGADLANPVGVVDDFAATLREELDFRKEAANLDRFNEIMRELGHRTIRAPRPMAEFVTPRVLVMERFFGVRVDQYDEIRRRGLDGETQLVSGLRAWFQCVVFYGFFHGDVHAGNLMMLDDKDIGFLDFGIVGRFDDDQRWLVIDYMIAFSTGDYRKLGKVICEMTETPQGLDMDKFVDDLKQTYSPLLTLSFKDVNYAEFLPGIQRVATRHRVRMPKEFILITKQLLYFDRYAKALAPNLNVFTDSRLVLGMMSDIQKARMEHEARRKSSAS
jgi:predicted unusual protein kinase regulating ubiquinone biosynthesis (AarF/ABC1/UbiB family)